LAFYAFLQTFCPCWAIILSEHEFDPSKGLKIGSKHGLKPIFADFCFLKTKVLDIFVNNEKMKKKSPSPEGRFSQITRQI